MRTSVLYRSAGAITPSRYAVLAISGAAAVSYLPEISLRCPAPGTRTMSLPASTVQSTR
jgi:hypothetical protein